MNRLIVLLLLLCPSLGLAQQLPAPVNEVSGKVSFREVVIVSGADSAELYKRAALWIDDNYPYSKDRFQMQSGQPVIIRSSAPMGVNNGSFILPMKLHYNLSMLVEDGQYTYELTDLRWQFHQDRYGVPEPAEIPVESLLVNSYYDSKGKPIKTSVAYWKGTKESVTTLLTKLEEAMGKPTVNNSENRQ